MYNNPYNFYPYMNNAINVTANRAIQRPSIFKGLANIKWGNILTNTQKTLNVINQAIPVYYQIKPIWTNMKSFTKILNAFNSNDNNVNSNDVSNNFNSQNKTFNQTKKETSSNSPTFFIS